MFFIIKKQFKKYLFFIRALTQKGLDNKNSFLNFKSGTIFYFANFKNKFGWDRVRTCNHPVISRTIFSCSNKKNLKDRVRTKAR